MGIFFSFLFTETGAVQFSQIARANFQCVTGISENMYNILHIALRKNICLDTYISVKYLCTNWGRKKTVEVPTVPGTSFSVETVPEKISTRAVEM